MPVLRISARFRACGRTRVLRLAALRARVFVASLRSYFLGVSVLLPSAGPLQIYIGPT